MSLSKEYKRKNNHYFRMYGGQSPSIERPQSKEYKRKNNHYFRMYGGQSPSIERPQSKEDKNKSNSLLAANSQTRKIMCILNLK